MEQKRTASCSAQSRHKGEDNAPLAKNKSEKTAWPNFKIGHDPPADSIG
jgi:hypothetical protein